MSKERKIAVIGLGYVGLPVALALGRKSQQVVGFDVNIRRVKELAEGHDLTGEADPQAISSAKVTFSFEPSDLKKCDFFIVAVPTPIDDTKRPDLAALLSASAMVGAHMPKGSIVVYESTVYPGLTEEVCGPALEKASGYKQGIDFKLGYSPERINPGDKLHTLEKIIKIVAGEDAETLDVVASVYGSIVEAGLFKASSIRVAEAAKVIENTQRDLNIALMNELAIIFDKMGISTREVLEAAGTKWNFLKFSPGLVGGHCIGVDPYYLTTKAEQLGYLPQVILAGRRINDGMGSFIAQKAIKLLGRSGSVSSKTRIGILGVTFKEDVSDIRNSRVPDIVAELGEFGIAPFVHDPVAKSDDVKHEYGIDLVGTDEFKELDAVIIAVSHKVFMQDLKGQLSRFLRPAGVVIDVKSVLRPEHIPSGAVLWQL